MTRLALLLELEVENEGIGVDKIPPPQGYVAIGAWQFFCPSFMEEHRQWQVFGSDKVIPLLDFSAYNWKGGYACRPVTEFLDGGDVVTSHVDVCSNELQMWFLSSKTQCGDLVFRTDVDKYYIRLTTGWGRILPYR